METKSLIKMQENSTLFLWHFFLLLFLWWVFATIWLGNQRRPQWRCKVFAKTFGRNHRGCNCNGWQWLATKLDITMVKMEHMVADLTLLLPRLGSDLKVTNTKIFTGQYILYLRRLLCKKFSRIGKYLLETKNHIPDNGEGPGNKIQLYQQSIKYC